MKGPFSVVYTNGVSLNSIKLDEYLDATDLGQTMIGALDGNYIFVAVYDAESTRLWSYEHNKEQSKGQSQ